MRKSAFAGGKTRDYEKALMIETVCFFQFQVIETKSSIASKMAELERLQNRLKTINQESYRQKDHDESEF